jgi:hypothetical protein
MSGVSICAMVNMGYMVIFSDMFGTQAPFIMATCTYHCFGLLRKYMLNHVSPFGFDWKSCTSYSNGLSSFTHIKHGYLWVFPIFQTRQKMCLDLPSSEVPNIDPLSIELSHGILSVSRLTGAKRREWMGCWGLLGWLWIVIMDHSRKFPAFCTSKQIIYQFFTWSFSTAMWNCQKVNTKSVLGFLLLKQYPPVTRLI